MSNGLVFLVYTLSPLHAGIGQSIGKVDLPIEREKHTTYPCVYATGLKGALKKYCDKNNGLDIKLFFGDESDPAGMGGAIFTDLKILLFPVRSSKDCFKWVTCNHVLERFKRDLTIVSYDSSGLSNLSLTNAAPILDGSFDPQNQNHVILEDFVFTYQNIDASQKFLHGSWDVLKDNVYTIENGLFKYFVNHATQIIARNKLKENKTSDNLWYEETLPADTVLYSFIKPSVANQANLSDLKTVLDNKICQIGGNETVGYGICKLYFF